MKQVSNSLLTHCSTPFIAILDAPVFPRDMAGAINRNLTPFYFQREKMQPCVADLPTLSCPPRSLVHSRLGEGRIRNLLRECFLTVLVVCILAPFVRTAVCSDGVVIRLKEETAVLSNAVQLKDVADLKGSNPELLDKLAHISLGATPEFGSVRILSRHQIGESLHTVAGSLSGIAFVGAQAVQIRLQGRPVDPDEIAPLIKEHVVRTTQWTGSEIEIRSIANLEGIEVPHGAEFRLSPNATVTGNRNIMVPIEIVLAGKTLRSLWITASVDIQAGILTAARKIPYGKIITADDVIKRSVEIIDMRAVYMRHLKEILQKEASRSFSPGDPLTCEAFKNPFLVKSGETVQLRLVRNGIALTSRVRAEQNGSLGEIIRVRNLDFSTTLKAEVTGKSEVRVPQ